MEFQIDKETQTALETNLSVRFLFRVKLKAESRHSSDAIPWAQRVAEKVTRQMMDALGRPSADPDIQLNVIRLMANRPYALICYDLFLRECDEQARNDISHQAQQPIHEIIKRRNVFHVLRSKKMDAMVAAQYQSMMDADHGTRPYFADSLHPPVYVDGKRIERSKNGSPDPDEPEGWDWDEWERSLKTRPGVLEEEGLEDEGQ